MTDKPEQMVVWSRQLEFQSFQYIKEKTVKDVIELGDDTDSNASLFCALKGTEGDEAVLKYKDFVRQSEQIDCFIKLLYQSYSYNVKNIQISNLYVLIS